MKLFLLWRDDDHAGAIVIAKQALELAEATISKRSDAMDAEIAQLREAALNAEGEARGLEARLKRVRSASKEL